MPSILFHGSSSTRANARTTTVLRVGGGCCSRRCRQVPPVPAPRMTNSCPAQLSFTAMRAVTDCLTGICNACLPQNSRHWLELRPVAHFDAAAAACCRACGTPLRCQAQHGFSNGQLQCEKKGTAATGTIGVVQTLQCMLLSGQVSRVTFWEASTALAAEYFASSQPANLRRSISW